VTLRKRVRAGRKRRRREYLGRERMERALFTGPAWLWDMARRWRRAFAGSRTRPQVIYPKGQGRHLDPWRVCMAGKAGGYSIGGHVLGVDPASGRDCGGAVVIRNDRVVAQFKIPETMLIVDDLEAMDPKKREQLRAMVQEHLDPDTEALAMGRLRRRTAAGNLLDTLRRPRG